MGGNIIDNLAEKIAAFKAWFANLNPTGKFVVGCFGIYIFLCICPYLFFNALLSLGTDAEGNEQQVGEAEQQVPTNTRISSLTATVTLTPSISPSTAEKSFSGSDYEGGDCIPRNVIVEEGMVTEVIDGDTIVVDIDGEIFHVRYIGIDSPERGEYYSSQASIANRSLVFNQTLYLVRDVSEEDIYNRLLRYAFSETTFVNYQLVKKGYAYSSSYPPDTACDVNLRIAEVHAMGNRLGMWLATKTPIPPTSIPYVAPTSTPQTSGGDGGGEANGCNPYYPSVCLDKQGDYDCASGSGNGPNYVSGPITVLPPDPYGLDRDGDGIGCEG